MPVRSLNSSVLKWPDPQTVIEAVRRWAESVGRKHRTVRAIGYFGSYARGNWGVGSDLDIVIITSYSEEPFERRSLLYDAAPLPVPADILVYTEEEWARLKREGGFPRALEAQTVWIYTAEGSRTEKN